MSDIDVSLSADEHEASDPFAEWDAAYVVGALSPAERRSYEAHLENCANCRTGVADLAGMPGLLTSIAHEFVASPTDEVGAGDDAARSEKDRHAPKELLPTLLGTVTRSRRRRRLLSVVASATAVAAATVAVVLVPNFRNDASQTPAAIVLDQATPSPLHAQVRLVSREWGTQLYLKCQYARDTPGFAVGSSVPSRPDTDKYALAVTDRSGHVEQIATWTAGSETTVEPVASTSLAVEQIAKIQIVAADGTVLLERAH
jgi:hypothetical protein